MPFDLQPTLKGSLVELRPLRADDFDALFAVAADPLVWEQHPATDRYQEQPFRTFFQEALNSGGALIVYDTRGNRVIGSSRFHGYDPESREVRDRLDLLSAIALGRSVQRRHQAPHVAACLPLRRSRGVSCRTSHCRSQRAVERIGGIRAGTRRDGNGRESLMYEVTTATFS
jgi:N-acetyltransferase